MKFECYGHLGKNKYIVLNFTMQCWVEKERQNVLASLYDFFCIPLIKNIVI